MRAEGCSLKEIAATVGVSLASVSVWVRDVELTEEQRAVLLARNPATNGQLVGVAVQSAQARERRREQQQLGRLAAKSGDLLHAAGCMLFWAEGSRRRNTMCFTNSDPAMIAFFVRFLRTRCGVAIDSIRVDLNLFADHTPRQSELEQFWLDLLELPRSSLRKSTVNVYSKYSEKKRQNRLPYGTCRIAVHSTALVQQLYGAIQEYAVVDRPEWLD